jgi:hypothetical protein
MWQSTENEYGILSTVPPDLPMLGKNFHDHFEVPHICQATFTDRYSNYYKKDEFVNL